MTQEKNRVTNRLINEKSPYLLQHAHNPVNWYPWCQEAFTRAKSENKPIFLSIGYSTCHWCHVMAHESFEDQEVANLLNESFISIKVDKEERPDIDSIYMSACQAMNGHGGWPLTVLMTPEQKPFFTGTYLPKHSTRSMMGLIDVLTKILSMWNNNREQIYEAGERITEIIRDQKKSPTMTEEPSKRLFGQAYLQLKQRFDGKYGGFGPAPKFPIPHNLLFLLRYGVLFQEKTAIDMVEKTLDGMFAGGLYDHIGGGFSRYSTDEKWLVPHFEKMLYDNAMLVIAYAEAYQVTKKPLYEKVIRETLQYVMAEMTDENGAFYCAQDADSEGEEGKYYVVTPEEVYAVLGNEDGTRFNEYYQITEHGNFEGSNIPNLIGRELTDKEEPCMKKWREAMYEYRKNRMKLHKDDKILTSWNGLMIVAFAKAYQVLGDWMYLDAAVKALSSVNNNLRHDDNRLAIRYREGHQYGNGNLDDYAFLAYAELTLYGVTFEPMYLAHAKEDVEQMIALFWDEEDGGFFFSGTDAEQLIMRPKEVYDGAIPSGNSVAAYVLARLEKMTRDDNQRFVAKQQFQYIAEQIRQYPSAYSFSLCALMLDLMDTKVIVAVLKDPIDCKEMQQLMREYYLPTMIVIPIEEENEEGLAEVIPYVKEYKRTSKESEFYVCENFSCQPPFGGMERLKSYLQKCVE